jgi:hypothetical protein
VLFRIVLVGLCTLFTSLHVSALKDEVVPEDAPDIWDLLDKEDVDQLQYLSWTGDDEV